MTGSSVLIDNNSLQTSNSIGQMDRSSIQREKFRSMRRKA